MNLQPLTEKDYRDFAESFCSREFVDLFGIFRANDEDAAQTLGRKRNAYTPWESVVFPHYDTNGNVVEYCCKPDKPETEKQPDGTERAKYKYLFPPGRGGVLYFSPNADKELFKDISKPLVATEGKKQLITVTRIATNDNPNADNWHFLPIAINGVWGWRSKATGGVIQQFDEIAFQFRHVYIVFDSDVSTNWKVRYAQQQLALELQRRGAIVYLVNLPETSDKSKNGIDDLLAKVETESSSAAAIEKGLKLILKDSQIFNGEMLATISTGNITLGAAAAERGKCRLTAKKADGSAAAMDVFNPADAARREKFIKQINEAIHLSNDEKREIAAELINLADAAGAIFTVGPELTQKVAEAVETTFKVLTDGRIVEQIRGGFAIYNPETGDHEITDSVEDADGTTYTPVDDELFTKKGGIQLAEQLTEYGTETQLIEDVENYLSSYLDLKPLFLKLTAFYILFTYISDSDSILELSYLNATGDAGSGKSRFGMSVCYAAHRGLALITPSAASLYRIVDKFKPTLFLDEFNSDVNSDDTAAIIQILNAGFQQTAQIPRQVPTADGKYKTEMFDAFCPKIIGSLKQSASNAFNSRCIEIQMERTTRNDIPLRLSRKHLSDALSIRNKLTLWRMRNIQTDFDGKLDQAERELRESGIMPRSIQINIPLFALINDDKLKREFITLLKGRDEILNDEKQRTFDGELIQTLHTILFDVEENGTAVWSSQGVKTQPADGELCEHLRIEKIVSMLNDGLNQKDHFNSRYIGKKISGFGLRSSQILSRKSDYHKKSAIRFDSHRLKIIFKNYGLPVPGDFCLDQLDQNSNINTNNDLTRSNEKTDGNGDQTPLDQVKINEHNNNGERSNWSNEKSGIEAKEIKVLVDEVI
jgi:hypothetical protein